MPVISEAEEMRKQFLNLLYKIFVEVYNKDRRVFSDKLSLETWLADDIINTRWGTVTADFIVSKIEKAARENKDAARIISEQFNIDNPEDLLKILKKQTCKYIDSLSKENGLSAADVGIREDVFEALRDSKVNLFTLESLCEVSSKARSFKKEQPVEDILDVELIKKNLAAKIRSDYLKSGLTKSKYSLTFKINRSDLSLILNNKEARFSIEKLIEIFSSNKKLLVRYKKVS